MKSLFQESTRREIRTRVARLQPWDRPRWGSLTVDRMVAHVTDSLRVTFGELRGEHRPSFLSTPLGRWFAVSSPIPWPRGLIEAPAVFFTTPPSTDIDSDKQALLAYVQRFSLGPDQTWGVSPLLGRLSAEEWARVDYRHLDHHLRQFGC